MTKPAAILSDLAALRGEISEINDALLALLSRRGRVVAAIQQIKSREGLPTYAPERERAMLAELVRKNPGPYSDEAVARLFAEIFRASVELMEEQKAREPAKVAELVAAVLRPCATE